MYSTMMRREIGPDEVDVILQGVLDVRQARTLQPRPKFISSAHIDGQGKLDGWVFGSALGSHSRKNKINASLCVKVCHWNGHVCLRRNHMAGIIEVCSRTDIARPVGC